jgi:hypothetical protein
MKEVRYAVILGFWGSVGSQVDNEGNKSKAGSNHSASHFAQ